MLKCIFFYEINCSRFSKMYLLRKKEWKPFVSLANKFLSCAPYLVHFFLDHEIKKRGNHVLDTTRVPVNIAIMKFRNTN